MCLMCYIATDAELESRPWREDAPGFCIEPKERTEFPESLFTAKNIYYLGTHEGCGCRFGEVRFPDDIVQKARNAIQHNHPMPEECKEDFEYDDTLEKLEYTIAENQAFAEDTAALYRTIHDSLAKGNKAEFMACWAENEHDTPKILKVVNFRNQSLQIDFDTIREAAMGNKNTRIDFTQQ